MIIAEGKPWEPMVHPNGGADNLGSAEFSTTVGLTTYAYDLLAKAGGTPEPARIRYLARMLLEMCDEVQATLRPDSQVSRKDSSHTRVRSILHSVLGTNPLPVGASDEVRQTWRRAVVAEMVAVSTIAYQLAGGERQIITAAVETLDGDESGPSDATSDDVVIAELVAANDPF
jgi:hypothetical protein